MKKLMIFILMTFVFLILSIQINLANSLSTTSIINNYTKEYQNLVFGYKMNFYYSMSIDESIFDKRTRFENEKKTIDIFYDDFNYDDNNFAKYKNYGNRSLMNNSLFTVQSSKNINFKGIEAHLLYYTRPKLKNISNDKNYYACLEIPKSNKNIYTIVLKSTHPITDFEAIYNTFDFNEPTNNLPKLNKTQTISKKFDTKTQEFYNEMFLPESKLNFGIFEPMAPYNLTNLINLEDKFDYDFPVVMKYQHMNRDLPLEELINAKNSNKVVQLTLQTTKKEDVSVDITYKILDGEYDDYFIKYANDLNKLDYPVLFRLNNEMNGDWCKYSAYHYGKDADLYIELYRYIYDIFKSNGVDNAIFVWNPNEKSFPDFAWNNYMAYYPGDEYVDIVGLTGYNTGNYYEGEVWRSFEEIYNEFYYEYADRFSQPLMITEFGSSSFGGDKSLWIEDMFKKIPSYDRIKLAIWWSGVDKDSNGNPARIYKIDENDKIIEAIKNGLSLIKK